MKRSAEHVPNPRRVAAGRANRLKRGPLTEAGRERLRVAALDHQPWLHSTGPRSEAGRARAASNGRRRQTGVFSTRQARAKLAEVRSFIRAILETWTTITSTF
jgi:hypothetical protein